MNTQEQKPNGLTSVLSTLASSGDNWVKLGTLALVAVSGIGNFVQTQRTGAENRHQIDRDVREIWQALDRNKDEFHRMVQDSDQTRKLLEDLNRRLK